MEDRDLSFRPVVNDKPAILSQDQICMYNELGYIMPLDVFSDQEAAKNRSYFDGLLSQVRHSDVSYAINSYQVCCRGIYDLATDKRILDYVEDLIGPDIIAWSTHFFCKKPHDPKVIPWHQDASYWPLTPARSATAWLAIDDVDIENAAMQFIPGTHKLGALSCKEFKEPANIFYQEVADAASYGKPVSDALRAG
jgi:ectoine hydroxylase-related dioxygenase (phytanoyl-CoA dioxygenase family)